MMKAHTGALMRCTGAMVIWGTIGVFRRWIPLSSGLLACARGIIGGLFLLCWMMMRGVKPSFGQNSRQRIMPMITGALIGLNWILLFEAFQYTSVAAATLCYYMEPTLLILLSPIVFRERMTVRSGICALVSLVGMILISGVIGTGTTDRDFTGVLLALGAAVLYTTVVILNKKAGNDGQDATSRTMVQLFSAAVVLIPYLLFTANWGGLSITPVAAGLTLFVGVLHTGVAYAMYFGSMGNLSSRLVAMLSYLDPVTALLLSALLLNEPMTFLHIIGAILILGAAMAGELLPRAGTES